MKGAPRDDSWRVALVMSFVRTASASAHGPRLAAIEDAEIMELAILPSHVHVLMEVSALSDLPRLVQRLKGASARFANRDGWSSRGRALRWDPGYDSRSVARLALPDIRRYLDRQAEKHHMPLLARWSRVRDKAA